MLLPLVAACGPPTGPTALPDQPVVLGEVLDVIAGIDPGNAGVSADAELAAFLAETEWATGARATAFLAHTDDPALLGERPVGGAAVFLATASGARRSFGDQDDGSYSLPPGEAVYGGAGMVLGVDRSLDDPTIEFYAPDPAHLDLPWSMPLGSAVSIDLGGQGYDEARLLVVAPDGTTNFSNQPQSIDALYATFHEPPLGVAEIPAEAFPAPGSYAVGVGGMLHTRPANVVNSDDQLTGVSAGVVVFGTVQVTDD